MNMLMLSCKKATGLIDKKSVVGLSLLEKIQLRVHTSMCDACTAYQKQSKLIDRIIHQHINGSNETTAPLVNNPALKENIISKHHTL